MKEIDFFCFSNFIFKENHVLLDEKILKLIVEDKLSEKIVIVKEELDGTDIDDIEDLEDLLKIVFLHQKWRNLKVFLDGGELTKNNHEKPGVLQAYRCPLRDKCFKREYFFNKYGNQ